MNRPYNHVSPKPEAYTPELFPDLTEKQVASFEAAYPPACLGRHQTVEDHLRYAGVVEFISILRAHLKLYQSEDQEGDITQDVL